jgi:hypothetical protein
MQQIISSEFKFSRLLRFEEASNEEKVAYEKTKVGQVGGKLFVFLCF